LDCPLKYIGQTGRTFKTRYKEHIQAIRNNNGKSGYSKHILNTGAHIRECNRHDESLKNAEKGKAPKHTGEILYVYIQDEKKRNTNERRMHRHPQPDIRNDTKTKQQIATQSQYKRRNQSNPASIKNKTGNGEQGGARHTKRSEYTNK
jgi:hypothetical protein